MLAKLLDILDRAYKTGEYISTDEALGFIGFIKLVYLFDGYYKVVVVSEHTEFTITNDNMFTIIDETKRYITSFLLA